MPIQECLTDAYPLDLLLLADPEESVVRSYLNRSSCFTLVTEDKVVGGYLLLPTRPRTIELVNIAVYEEYQRRGFAKQMIEHAKEQARITGYHTMEVGTATTSFGPLALYQRMGFRITGIDYDFFVRHYKESIYDDGVLCRDMLRLSLDL
ncbi:MAG: GNAT family N-acetyltransferase [Spirochaetia bacterium]|nr:GNAT family N-acetyltransferase [Spirochaetia bacterium]